MKKIISFVGMFAVMGAVFGDAHGVAMSANIRRLLQEKQDKIAKLEECEGKKQGWMIAGISTIGLTAVGVGVNIAQASKSNRLSDEIEMEKTTLQRQQGELDRISNQIADERAKQTTQKDGVKNKREKTGAKNANVDDSEFGSKSIDEFITNLRSTYSDISVKCGDNYTYVFIPGDEKTDEFARIKQECINAGGNDFVRVGDRIITKNDKSQNVDLYQCKAEWKCEEKEIQPLGSQIKKEDLFTSSGENARSGCEKYNHYEIKLSDNNTEYVYNFLYGDEDCESRFVARCSDIGGEWVFGASYSDRDIREYRCWNPKALGRDYSGLGFDDFVKQECERYGGEANRSNAFMYYCVGIKNNECNKIKTAFEAAGYPDPITVSFDKKLKDAQTGAWTSFSGWQSKEVNWKNVCTIEAFGNDVEEYVYNPQ